MKKLLLSLTLLIAFNTTTAQVKVGLKSDINGIPFNGYFDPLIYAPTNKIVINHNSDSYEIGSYIDQSGETISGLIKFGGKKIWFKKGEHQFKDKIKPDEVKNFEIGVDSFFTISKYNVKNSLKTKPTYVQYVSEFGNFKVAKHYKFIQENIKESFFIKSSDSDTWEDFPIKKNLAFRMKALPYFRQVPYLDFKISTSQYTEENLLSIIKMAEYYDKHQKSEAIYYDKYWHEVRNENGAEYKALISKVKDTIWTFDYYRKDNTKLYQANYSEFYPNIKNGNFTAYYPNGSIRKVVFYKKNKPQEVKEYKASGMLHMHYKIIDNNTKPSSTKPIEIRYLVVNDSLGTNILANNNPAILTKKDELNNEKYTHVYKNNKLVSVYRLLNGIEVHQITDTEYDFKIKSIQGKFHSFMKDKKYEIALSENAQGIILVSFIIDEKGLVVESNMLNKIHPEIDGFVDEFISKNLTESKYSFKPFKKEKIKSHCEVIVPFEFNINRFYRIPQYFNQFFFNNQFYNLHMMHFQQRPTPLKF